MPKHFEFVLAAYSIWVAAFAVYLFYLHRKARMAERALERMSGAPRDAGP